MRPVDFLEDEDFPTVGQVAFVFAVLTEYGQKGGHYRDLIKRLGLPKSAYTTLWEAGALDISNMLTGAEDRYQEATVPSQDGLDLAEEYDDPFDTPYDYGYDGEG